MRHAICYISSATQDFSEQEIQDYFHYWREKNEKENIKGIVLFSEGHFFQVLEGDKSTVLALFEEINNDPRHTGIIQVLGKDIERGSLDGYYAEHIEMGNHSHGELIRSYCESVKGMDPRIQQQIKTILESFLDTRVL